jgi:hypothetical protein
MTDKRQPEPSNRELIDGAVRKIVTALVIAGGVIALGIYSRPGPPRYQAFAAEGQIVRIDMRSGTVIACEGNQCMTVVRRGRKRPCPPPLQKRDRPGRSRQRDGTLTFARDVLDARLRLRGVRVRRFRPRQRVPIVA